MAELIAQFEEAVRNVEPSADDKRNASDAHQEVRDCLSEDPGLNAWRIETVLIGSYKRHVSIRRVKDVDVLSKLPALPDDMTPDDVLDAVGTALRSCDPSDRLEPQDRSFKVLFPGFDLHVDVVPARLAGQYLEIPDRRGDDADDSERGWVLTNPEELTRLTTEQNEAYEGMYVPIVKLVRQTRRTRIGQGQKPGGFFFEILTYHAFEGGIIGGPLPDTDRRTEVRVTKDGFCRVGDVDYSVPPGLSGRRLQVKVSVTEVMFFSEGTELARHRRSYVPADVVLAPTHARALRLARQARQRLEAADPEIPDVDLGRYDALAEVSS